MQTTYENKNTEIISIKTWLLYLFILGIPFVNIIVLIVWAFDNYNVARSNFAKASLIMGAIGFVLMFIFYYFIYSAMDSMHY